MENEANIVQITVPWTNPNSDQNHEEKTFFSVAYIPIRGNEQEELKILIENKKLYIIGTGENQWNDSYNWNTKITC